MNNTRKEENRGIDDNVVLWDSGRGQDGAPIINEQLPAEKPEEVQQVLEEYKDIFRNGPGRTHITEYRIRTGASPPICLPLYRLPHAYRDSIKPELEQMEQDRIIEPSQSEWAFLIILVKTKDGTLRMCVDYCHLNIAITLD